MQTFAQLTYETFLAYTMPGFVSLWPFFYLGYFRFSRPKEAVEITTIFLMVLFISILAGALIDMAGHVAFADWRRKRKQFIYWGNSPDSTLLQALLERRYPESSDWSESQKSTIVDSLFIKTVSSHIFARRNWDYALHDASRNLLVSSSVLILGIIFLYIKQIIDIIPAVGVIIITLLLDYFSLWRYMRWSIDNCYGYHVSMILSYLLEKESATEGAQKE